MVIRRLYEWHARDCIAQGAERNLTYLVRETQKGRVGEWNEIKLRPPYIPDAKKGAKIS